MSNAEFIPNTCTFPNNEPITKYFKMLLCDFICVILWKMHGTVHNTALMIQFPHHVTDIVTPHLLLNVYDGFKDTEVKHFNALSSINKMNLKYN